MKFLPLRQVDYGFRPSALWDMQQRELEEKLRVTIEALAEVSEDFTPYRFEQKFGMGNPSLILRSDDGAEIRLHGYIDRLDVDQHGRLRVIDYKASGSPISAKDVEKGKRLQLPLYALAAQEALQLGEVVSGFYWHILQGQASSFKLEKYPDGAPAAFDQVKQHVIDHVQHIRAGRVSTCAARGRLSILLSCRRVLLEIYAEKRNSPRIHANEREYKIRDHSC